MSVAQKVSPFLSKLYTIIESSNYENCIKWSETGDAFSLTNFDQFASEVLPIYFKHNNFATFVRQLNMYSFSKVNNALNADKKSGLHVGEVPVWWFTHPSFKRGHPELMTQIIRKAYNPNDKKKAATSLISNHSSNALVCHQNSAETSSSHAQLQVATKKIGPLSITSSETTCLAQASHLLATTTAADMVGTRTDELAHQFSQLKVENHNLQEKLNLLYSTTNQLMQQNTILKKQNMETILRTRGLHDKLQRLLEFLLTIFPEDVIKDQLAQLFTQQQQQQQQQHLAVESKMDTHTPYTDSLYSSGLGILDGDIEAEEAVEVPFNDPSPPLMLNPFLTLGPGPTDCEMSSLNNDTANLGLDMGATFDVAPLSFTHLDEASFNDANSNMSFEDNGDAAMPLQQPLQPVNMMSIKPCKRRHIHDQNDLLLSEALTQDSDAQSIHFTTPAPPALPTTTVAIPIEHNLFSRHLLLTEGDTVAPEQANGSAGVIFSDDQHPQDAALFSAIDSNIAPTTSIFNIELSTQGLNPFLDGIIDHPNILDPLEVNGFDLQLPDIDALGIDAYHSANSLNGDSDFFPLAPPSSSSSTTIDTKYTFDY